MVYHTGYGYYGIAVCYLHNGNALGGTSHGGNIVYFNANDDAFPRDCHDLFVFLYDQRTYDFSVAGAWTDGEYPFAAAGLLPLFGQRRAFPVTISGNHQQVPFLANNLHAHYKVVVHQLNTSYAFGSPCHRPRFFFCETNRLAAGSY